MTVGDRIRARRKELKLSAEEVAARMNVSPSTVYRYESEEISNMGIDKLPPIAEALDTTPAYLMGWSDNPYPPTPVSDPHLTAILTKLSDRSDLRALLSVYDGATEEEIAYAIALIKAKRGLM